MSNRSAQQKLEEFYDDTEGIQQFEQNLKHENFCILSCGAFKRELYIYDNWFLLFFTQLCYLKEKRYFFGAFYIKQLKYDYLEFGIEGVWFGREQVDRYLTKLKQLFNIKLNILTSNKREDWPGREQIEKWNDYND